MNDQTILVVDDEEAQRETLSGYLKKKNYRIFQADNGEKGVSIIEKHQVDMVLTDMRMPGISGIELLKKIKSLNPEISVVVMTAYGSIDDATEAMKSGAEDYIQKPIDLDHLDLIIKRVFERRQLVSENRALKQALHSKYDFKHLISGSAKMENVLSMASRAAQSKAAVLLRGESGTGKEVLARAIHLASPRADKPFVPVNVAAVTETLIESEFFGHEKGAFTGADRQRKGRFEMADQGTLFIDEIGDIPVTSQVKLLRVLQEQAFERVGGSQTINVDVRVISATHQNLEEMIKNGKFREDLFYRLNVVTINIPPLRERREEIPLFIDYFLRRFSQQEGKETNSISKEAMDLLIKYNYPGNVRELENIVQRAVVMARSDIITTDDLPPQIRSAEQKEACSTMTECVAALEKRLITEALKTSGGNQTQAARSLGLTERNLRYKMKKYGMK